MKVSELIAQLQKAPADAEVVFYNGSIEALLPIKHVEGGKNQSRKLCVVGEVTMQVKCSFRDARATSQPDNDMTDLFNKLFKGI